MQRGFTLVECLISLALMVVILLLALPRYDNFLENTKEQLLSTQLLRAINLARSEAMLRNTTVSLCGSSDQLNCTEDWIKGFLIFLDPSEENLDKKIIAQFKNKTMSGHLYWHPFRSDQPNLQFSASGTTNENNGTFSYIRAYQTKPIWFIIINKFGRARFASPMLLR